MLVAGPAFSTVGWSQVAPQDISSVSSESQSASDMDQVLAREISQAWSENKDASDAVAFQENGEIAFSEGNEKEAMRYFKTAQKELGHLKSSPVPM